MVTNSVSQLPRPFICLSFVWGCYLVYNSRLLPICQCLNLKEIFMARVTREAIWILFLVLISSAPHTIQRSFGEEKRKRKLTESNESKRKSLLLSYYTTLSVIISPTWWFLRSSRDALAAELCCGDSSRNWSLYCCSCCSVSRVKRSQRLQFSCAMMSSTVRSAHSKTTAPGAPPQTLA